MTRRNHQPRPPRARFTVRNLFAAGDVLHGTRRGQSVKDALRRMERRER